MMQRLTCFAKCRELSGIAVRSSQACPWRKTLAKLHTPCRPWTHEHCFKTTSLYEKALPSLFDLPYLRMRNTFLTGQKYRPYSTSSGNDSTKGTSRPGISVVGTPDPITWIRNKVIFFLIELYFDLKITSVEFDHGVKQAVSHVSTMLSDGKFEELQGVMSKEAVTHVRKKYKTLTEAQRRHLAIPIDDIIFLHTEDVSVVFDHRGRKFCYIIIRFWHLSSADVPEDPEGTRIFKMACTDEESPPKKIVTAVYESIFKTCLMKLCLTGTVRFHSELSQGADPDWIVTHIWHWRQLE